MISVRDAFNITIDNMKKQGPENISVTRCTGRVLAEDVLCDIDMPPFDRSAMDGFALVGSGDSWKLLPEITAGTDPEPLEHRNTAAPIMTGAPVPAGADRVVMVEHTEVRDGVLTVSALPEKGANICFQAEDIEAGQVVLSSGLVLSPAETGIASMAGRSVLKVFSRPEVSVLTTGSEVIPPVQVPGPGQVRNANSSLMAAHLTCSGYTPSVVLHAADDPASLENAAAQALLTSDILLTAGGISMGTRDYIPEVMEKLGFRFLFRTVAQKPGKPFSLAVRESDHKIMFGLPGNPVSVLVGLESYVLPALRYVSGHTAYRKKTFTGICSKPLKKKAGRQYFYRGMAEFGRNGWTIDVPPSSGSGDLMSTRGTNSLAWLSAESTGIPENKPVPFALMSWAGGESCWE